ncbi:MAG: baseplate J/gp47 family protein, partial [Pseudomonadota bacterium]
MVGEMGYQALQYAEHLSRDRFVSTAAGPGLDKRAADEGVQRLPARYAEGQVDVTGNPFAAVPVGVQFQRADGARYTVMTAATLDAAGTASVYVRAEVIGAAGNAPVGVVLTMTASVDGVSPAGRVSTAGVSGGASVETDENLRQRVLFSIRNPPSGGNTADYVRWARAALQTVTRVWVDPVTPENQRNSVGVWVAMDETYETGVPLASDLDIVRAYIDALRPAGALVNVAAPRPVAVSPIVQLSPDTAAVRSAVDAELAAFFAREGQVSTTVSPASVFRSRLV